MATSRTPSLAVAFGPVAALAVAGAPVPARGRLGDPTADRLPNVNPGPFTANGP